MKKVVIVGSGVIGLFCAVRLRIAGAQVTLLEGEAEHPSPFGPIASAAAAGMLAVADALPSPHEQLAIESLKLWREFQPGAEWADGLRFDGGVHVRANADDAQSFIRNAQRLGLDVSALNAGQARKRLGFAKKLDNAIFVGDEGTADPQRVLTGLAMQARAMGVVIEYHRDVENVTESAAMTHDNRIYEGDAVVLAPGVWATEKLMRAAPALKLVQPAKGHLVAVKTDAALGSNLHAPDFYMVRRREDVVIGATLEPGRYDRHVDETKVDALLDAARALLAGEVKAEGRAWAGIRPMSPDGWPMIGPSGDVLVAAGHSRNGWLLAPLTAEIISAYVFGREIEPAWAALAPSRFEAP